MKKLIITLLIVFSHVAYGMEFDVSDIYDDNVSPHVQDGADEAIGLLDETKMDALLDSDVESARTVDSSAPQSTRTDSTSKDASSCCIDPIKVDALFDAYPETQLTTISDEMKLPASTDDAVCSISCSKSFDQYVASDAMSDVAADTIDSNSCNGCFHRYDDVPSLPVADGKEPVQEHMAEGSNCVHGLGQVSSMVPIAEKTNNAQAEDDQKNYIRTILKDPERCGDVFVLIHSLVAYARNGDSFLLKQLIRDHFFDIYDHITTLMRADDYDDFIILVLYGLPLHVHPIDRPSLLFVASINKRTKIRNLLLSQSIGLSDDEAIQFGSSNQLNDFTGNDLQSTAYRQMLQIYFIVRNILILQYGQTDLLKNNQRSIEQSLQ